MAPVPAASPALHLLPQLSESPIEPKSLGNPGETAPAPAGEVVATVTRRCPSNRRTPESPSNPKAAEILAIRRRHRPRPSPRSGRAPRTARRSLLPDAHPDRHRATGRANPRAAQILAKYRPCRQTSPAWTARCDGAPGGGPPPSDRGRCCAAVQGGRPWPAPRQSSRMPLSISGTSASIVAGVTTPEPVLIDSPVMPYFFDSTHWVTGRKPCR